MTESFLARSLVFREFLIFFQKLAIANLLAARIEDSDNHNNNDFI